VYDISTSVATYVEVAPIAEHSRGGLQVTATAYFVRFCIVGLALWGLPFYYDFMVEQFGWTRAQVTSGNALRKLVVGPAFGFVAGWMVDRFDPRRMMMAGVLMAGVALVGLGSNSTLGMFYSFYMLNTLGYVCGGPLPNQVLLSRWFNKSRGRAMGFAYLGIGLGGAAVPWMSHTLVEHFGWQAALTILGLLIVVAFPMAFFVKVHPQPERLRAGITSLEARGDFRTVPFCMLIAGSMCSIAAVSGTQQNLKLFLSLDQHCRLRMSWLADYFPKEYVILLIYTLAAAAIPLLLLGQSLQTIYVFAIVFGIALGGNYMIVPLMAAAIFGTQVLGRLRDLHCGRSGGGGVTWMVGRVRDVSGTYSHGFLVLIGMALLGAAATATLPQRGWPE
jgi:MFS family permease